MISPQILLTDFDARQWINLLALLAPAKAPPKSYLVCILDGERCLKAWHSKKGVLWGFPFPGLERLEEARESAGADVVLCLPRGALQEIFYHAQEAVRPFDDVVKQALDMIAAGRDAVDRVGTWYPQKPVDLQLYKYEKLEKYFNKFWPDDSALGLFVFEGKQVHTSAILGKDHGEINVFTTLDAFGMSDQALDWRTNWKALAGMVAQRFAPLHSALFVELSSLREMRAGPRPLTYLRLAEKRGRALIYPKPFALKLALWAGRIFKGM
jgi:hypothetical protein